MARTTDRRPGGFTLLELILMLVLISTVLALAAPSLRGFVRSRETANAAARILALTQYARSQAISEARPYRLHVDGSSNLCWLASQWCGTYVELGREMGRPFALPPGAVVRLTDASGQASPLSWVQFYPDGRTDAAIIEITGAPGEVFRVACESATERFRILAPGESGKP